MLQFSPAITMGFSITDDAIVVQGEINQTVIADHDVIGISSEIQQVGYGEFRRNVVLEHISQDGCVQTTHVQEMVDGRHIIVDHLAAYVERVAPWAARNVAKQLAEVGTIAGNGYEIRGPAIMLTNGTSPISLMQD